MDTKELRLKDECFSIVGAAMEVHSQLGCGFLEAVYAEALAREFEERGIPHRQEVSLEIHYKGKPLAKTYRADFVVFNQIILEIKASSALGDPDRAQLLNYLKSTGFSLGLLINFGSHCKLEWVRMVH